MKNIEIIINDINKIRKSKKDLWFWLEGTFNDLPFRIKCYNTYTQYFRIGEQLHTGICDLNVTQWKKELQEILEYHL